jgi:hypothetical protein
MEKKNVPSVWMGEACEGDFLIGDTDLSYEFFRTSHHFKPSFEAGFGS